MATVVLAMSGGVDSSVSAALLQRQGHEVIGLFMRTGTESAAADSRPDRKKGCCSALDAGDGRRVADLLGIPFYALNFEREFDRVIDYFADEYIAGRTPNPCVVCNTWLKFGKLWQFAQHLGADAVATGHYARITRGADGTPELRRGPDPRKDQSYVLHGIKREVLDKLYFPVGGYTKDEIRAIARDMNLPVAQKPDSVEICFVPDGDHAALIRRRRPELQTAGNVVDREGNVLGEHDGYERFTKGQRKGLGLAGADRRYVLEVIPESRDVVLGPAEGLMSGGLAAKEVNWLIHPPTGPVRLAAQIRYRHVGAMATVEAGPDNTASVRFDEPQTAVTPGQAVAFYDGDRLLGGGWIQKTID